MFGIPTRVEVRELVSRAMESMSLSPTTRWAVPLTLTEQRKVGSRVVVGVTTLEYGRELVSRAAESVSLSLATR